MLCFAIIFLPFMCGFSFRTLAVIFVSDSFSVISIKYTSSPTQCRFRIGVQELYESRGGRPGLPVLMSLTVSVDVKRH